MRITTTLIALVFSGHLLAADYFLIPKTPAGEKKVKRLLKRKSVSQIFSRSERDFLQTEGLGKLASSIKIELSKASLPAWKKWLGKDVKLELRQPVAQQRALLGNLKKSEFKNREPNFSDQWALQNRGIFQELELSDIDVARFKGKKGEDLNLSVMPAEDPKKTIKVAILDTGIDYNHPDLASQIYSQPEECKAVIQYAICLDTQPDKEACHKKWASHDADKNGYPLDCKGWNVTQPGDGHSGVRGNNDAEDEVGHGTHIAGIVASKINSYGVQGVIQNVKILPVKVLDETDDGRAGVTSDDLPTTIEDKLPPISTFGDVVSRGMLYAIRSGADIINMSLGWSRGVDSELMHQLIELARKRGILVVASSGNDSNSSPIFPCIYKGVICVASYAADGSIATTSNFGSAVDLAAPGHNILSTWPTKKVSFYFTERRGFEFLSGTSMAAPQVVGALARLLNLGYSADAAYARLILSTRPHQASTIDPAAASKYTQSGNLDLGASLSIKEQSLVMPAKKDPVFIVWDRVSKSLDVGLPFKNRWKDGEELVLEFTHATKLAQQSIVLKQSHFEFAQWKAGEEKNIPLKIEILDGQALPSEWVLKVVISGKGQAARTTFQQVEMLVAMTKDFKAPEADIIQIDAKKARIHPESEMKTIQNIDSFGESDYVAFFDNTKRRMWEFTLLQMQEKDGEHFYKAKGKTRVRVGRGKLLGLYKLDLDGDGVRDYVLGYEVGRRQRAGDDDRGLPRKQAKFDFYDQNFKPLELSFGGKVDKSYLYDNVPAMLPQNFQWTKTKKGHTLVWVTTGTDPKDHIEPKPNAPCDPWTPGDCPDPYKKEPEEKDRPKDIRLYYVDAKGVQTVEVPEDHRYVDLLHPSEEQRKAGITPVLLVKGKNFELEFIIGLLKNMQFEKFIELKFPHFHMIGGLENLKTQSLLNERLDLGTTFGGFSNLNRFRTTSIHHALKEVDYDFGTQRSLNPLYRPHRLSGAFKGVDYSSTFVQTQYTLEYKNLKTGERANTSLKRFSFLPGYFFDNFFFPVVAKKAGQWLEAIVVPAGLGTSLTTEVIVPHYVDGKLQQLYRPAKFRFLPVQGCTELNYKPRTLSEAAKLTFYCGDKFIRVPLLL